MSIWTSLAAALALTLVLELVFSLAWGLRKQALGMVILMNLLTNPAANVLHHFMATFLGWSMVLPTLILEAAVIFTEGLCCRDFMEKPWVFVILANTFSYTAGLVLQQIL